MLTTLIVVLVLAQAPFDGFEVNGGNSRVKVGDKTMVLPLYPGKPAVVFAYQSDLTDYCAFLRASDNTGVTSFKNGGDTAFLDEGTEVLVLKTDKGIDHESIFRLPSAEVRILNGKHEGKAGWIILSELLWRPFRWHVNTEVGMKVVATSIIASDLEAYNTFQHVLKTGTVESESKVPSLRRATRIVSVGDGVRAEVVKLHPRSPKLTEPAVEIKILSGPLKNKKGFAHPLMCEGISAAPRRK